MATKTQRECAFAGCHRTTAYRYCAEHEAHMQQRRAADRRFYKSAQWKNICRVVDRRQGDICADCCIGHVTDYDHEIPRNRGGRDHADNVVGLCHSCHSRRTRTMQNAGLL